MNTLKRMVFPSHWTKLKNIFPSHWTKLKKNILLQPLFPLSLRKEMT